MSEKGEYYRDKVAVVTGGAGGVGLALMEAMLDFGARKVVLADFDDESLQREAARLETAYPGKVRGIRCDVTDEDQVQCLIAEAAGFGDGRIDLLFNNAGAAFPGRFDELSNADWGKAFALNLYGPLYGIRAVLPIMRAQGSGHIVDIISGIAFWPMAQQSMYAATKAALNNLTLSLRYEYWDENIRFSSATPGTTLSKIWERSGHTPPSHAQSPEQSAQTVLAGVARNERIAFGDQIDYDGGKHPFDPDAADGNDAYLVDNARKRMRGEAAV